MGEAAIDIHGSNAGTGHQAGNEDESIWDANTMQRVRDFAETVDDVKKSREVLNAKLSAAKTQLIDDGFNKDALEAAIKYARTEEDKRKNFDLTYLYARKALGHAIQDDLFAAATAQQVKVSRANKEDDQ